LAKPYESVRRLPRSRPLVSEYFCGRLSQTFIKQKAGWKQLAFCVLLPEKGIDFHP
jgi:hypothetical protein